LPLDTWIRLIDWMAIGLLVYFGYSFTNSKLAAIEDEAVDDVVGRYKPPIAAMVGILLVIALTIYQVVAPSSGLGLGLDPAKKIADSYALNLAIRLFAWVLTAILIWTLMYGKSDRNQPRSSSTRTIGLLLSIVNILVWV